MKTDIEKLTHLKRETKYIQLNGGQNIRSYITRVFLKKSDIF